MATCSRGGDRPRSPQRGSRPTNRTIEWFIRRAAYRNPTSRRCVLLAELTSLEREALFCPRMHRSRRLRIRARGNGNPHLGARQGLVDLEAVGDQQVPAITGCTALPCHSGQQPRLASTLVQQNCAIELSSPASGDDVKAKTCLRI